MIKIIFIYFVLSTTYYYSSAWLIEPMDTIKYECLMLTMRSSGVCGTDGKTYVDGLFLSCVQTKEYGNRVNLQLKHKGPCWIWEKYGYETYTVLSVSKLQIDSISSELYFIFA